MFLIQNELKGDSLFAWNDHFDLAIQVTLLSSLPMRDIFDKPGHKAEPFGPGRFAIILGVLIVAMFPSVLLFGQSFVLRDFGLFGYPLAFFHRQCFWEGEIPFLNPLNNGGLPFLAQWNTMTLYPGSLIYLLLPMPWSLSFFSLVHLFLAGMGMYFLARRWTGNSLAACVAGTAFVFNGFMLNCLMWPNYIASFGWMPWIVLASERAWTEGRRWIVGAALIGAMQMLSGTPEAILLTWFVIGAIWITELTRNKGQRLLLIRRFFTVVTLIGGISAIQLLPFYELLTHSDRDINFDAGHWSLTFSGLGNFFVPLFRMYRSSTGVYFQKAQGITSSYYLGIGVLALVALALCRRGDRRERPLAAAGLFCLIMALGSHLPVYAWVKTVFPFMGFMRYAAKFLMPVTFIAPLLAAFAVKHYTASTPEMAAQLKRASVIIAALFTSLIVLIITLSRIVPYEDEVWFDTLKSGLSRIPLLLAVLVLFYMLARASSVKRYQFLGLGLLAVIWLDVESHAPSQNPVVKADVFQPGLESLHNLKPQPAVGESRAMISYDAWRALHSKILSNPFEGYLCNRLGLFDNCNILDAIPKLDGFFALYIREEKDVRNALMTVQPFPTNVADFLSISQITAPEKVFDWEARPNVMPMITAGQKPVFVDSTNSLETLLNPHFDPRKVVLLPATSAARLSVEDASTARISKTDWRRHSIAFEVEATAPAMVVLSQVNYPAWKAFVDGLPVEIFTANHAFQALAVPAGVHRVQLVYKDRLFLLGAILTVTTLLICVAALLRFRVANVVPPTSSSNPSF